MRKRCMLWLLSVLFLTNSLFAQTTFTVQGHPRPDLERKAQLLSSKKKNTKSGDEFDYSKFTFDSIIFWVGEGENRAALVVDWYDDKGDAMVWGFRWHKDSTATGETMLRAVAAADPKFSVLIMGNTQYGSAVAGFGYDTDGTGEMCVKYKNSDEDIRCPDEQGVIYTDAYDFDDFNYPVNSGFRWFSAWVNLGYWSYQLKGEGQDEFTYSSVGATSRVLSDGDWDGWGAQVGWDNWNGVPPRMPFMAAALPSVASISLSYNVKGVEPSKSFSLTASVLPLYAQNKNVLWTSSDELVATVTSEGVVTGKAVGDAYIFATTEEGGYKDSCKVIVKIPASFPEYEAYWSEMGKDSSHLAVIDRKLARSEEEFSEKWKMELVTSGFINGGQPIIVDDYIYIAHNSRLAKIERSTGNIVKETALGGSCGFYSMIAYGEGKIFVPMSSGMLKAFNAETLEPIWKVQTSGYQHISQVVYHDGYVYTGLWKSAANGVYYCISAEDEDPFRTDEEKEYVWQTTDCGFYWAGGTVVGNAIIFGGDNGILQSRNRLTGEILDTLTIAPELTLSTIRSGIAYDVSVQRIYFTGKEAKKLYSIKINENGTFDKNTILSGDIVGQATTTPTVYNGRIYASSGGMTSKGGLDVFDANTLEKIYSVNMGGISQATPLLTTAYAAEENRNTVYLYLTLNNDKGSIVCIKDFEGNTEPLIQFTYTPSTTQYCTQSLIADEDGTIYYRNDSRYFFAFKSTPFIEMESISLNRNTDTLYVDVEERLVATVFPEDAYPKKLVWRSSNPEIAIVDSTGLVKALALGNVTIFVSNEEGTLTDSCVIAIQEVDYTKGTFFVNEDWFGHSNGSVNFLTENGKFIYRAYRRENPGQTLGATTQFGTIYGNNFYFVSKQAAGEDEGGRLVVADAKTLKKKAVFDTIGSGDGRSFLGVDESKGYLGTSNGIYLFDIKNLSIGKQIDNTAGGSLYSGQIGTMLRIGDYVFACKQSLGILVINTLTDKVTDTIECANIGTIVQSLDGSLWATAYSDGLWKINPYTLEVEEKREVPEEAWIPASWGAWAPSLICASHKTNTLYWAKMGGSTMTFFGKKIYKYDINNPNLEAPFYELTRTSETGKAEVFYGSAVNIDPVNNRLVITTTQDGYSTNYANNWVHFIDASTGELIEIKTLEKYYWFPSMSVFPDNHAPVIAEEIESVIELNAGEEAAIYLGDKVSDADNFNPAIIKRVSVIDGEEKVVISIHADTLYIEMLEDGVVTIQLTCNSNGKVVTKEIKVGKDVQGISGVNKKSVAVYPNPITSYVNISANIGDRIMVLDPMGRMVQELKAASKVTRVDLSNYAKGVYLINIEGTVVKVVKQ